MFTQAALLASKLIVVITVPQCGKTLPQKAKGKKHQLKHLRYVSLKYKTDEKSVCHSAGHPLMSVEF